MHLAVRPERDARKLRKRFGQGTVLSAWLIKQAAIIERVRRRAKRRRNLGARLRRLLYPAGASDANRMHMRRIVERLIVGEKSAVAAK